ncbi:MULTISPECIES: LamG domain-containing protein [Lysinibacillus]|uniref:LamG domain-containing protein n=1 Tax=Lysinibacillus TaxID=400634 RepID=UPI0004D4310E|nr:MULTISPECIES: LamG domain-containing protein [Lysinibacillus]
MATIGQTLPQPENGWKRYDDTSNFIGYFGTWIHATGMTSAYNNTETYTNIKDGASTIYFEGTKIRFIVSTGVNRSKNATITIDGITENYNAYSTTTVNQALIYEKIGLNNGLHKVELKLNDNNYLVVDAIDTDGILVKYDYLTSGLEKPLSKYGIAWFGFDEASGNVYDKLGNGYIGTVTGATRVEGWNGKVSSMNFSGSGQIIQMNNPIIPVGEKTIRFKVKIPSYKATSRLLSNATSITGVGLSVMFVDGKVSCVIRGTNAKSLTTPMQIEINVFQDIMIAFSGSTETDSISFYINEVLVFKSLIGTVEKQGTNNLFIGTDAFYNNANEYFQGVLDDLQIYNKALSPSDFEQKRLVVKTKDNKNLVLSPTSARVKEIPNTAEYMMLAQGGVVREIDSAVDRPPIDFTKPTTEYELVTNNRTPLGKGGMFTIPIGTDFKTAMIEDNY